MKFFLMLDLVLLPDERLKQASQPIKNIDAELIHYCDSMIETMHQAGGVGLAAVQTGRMDRIFVVHVDGDIPRVFINPEILDFSPKEDLFEEGCLSIPGVSAEVQRPVAVRVRALDRKGKEFTLEAEGFLARAIQHEYDHLEGKLFYEHLRPGQQRRLLRAYNKGHNAK